MIVIIGGGLSGLVAARELAQAGKHVTLLEERSKLGGLIASDTIGGFRLDIGAESFARRNSAVTDYVHSLGLDTLVPTGRSWIWNGKPLVIPADTSLGIPADPSSPEIVAALDHPERVAEDLVLDPSVGAEATTLAELVEARMGSELLEKLVRPIATAIYSTDPAKLAINPQLAADFRSAGTLSAAVARGLSGPAVASVKGGMFHLVDTLVAQAEDAGAVLVTDAKVISVKNCETASASSAVTVKYLRDGLTETLNADHVILATSIRPAVSLLESVANLEPFEIPTGTPTTHVTLVLDAPELDGAPRGSGMLCAQGTARAKALTHLTSKWGWLKEVTDLHAVRVSYAKNEEISAQDALEDLNTLMGVSLEFSQIVGSKLVRWGGALTPSTPALREWSQTIAAPEWMSITGAWRAGTGVASVIPHALATARELI